MGSESIFVGGKILAASVLCTQPQCSMGSSAVPGRSQSSFSTDLLDESLPYSLKANCGTQRSADYSCAGIWEQGRDGRSAPLALCHVKISPYIIWLPRASLHLLCTLRELWCQGMRLLRALPGAAGTCSPASALAPWHWRGDAWMPDLDFHRKLSMSDEFF